MFVGVADAKAYSWIDFKNDVGDIASGVASVLSGPKLQAQSNGVVSEVAVEANDQDQGPVGDPTMGVTLTSKNVPGPDRSREFQTTDGGLALLQSAPPSLVQFDENQVPKKNIIKYTVKDGDTLFSIADDFDINVETIMWANEGVIKGDIIRIGDVLDIPPVVGVVHVVRQGDTVGSLAKLYNAKEEDISDFNGLSGEFLKAGDIMIIPFGEKPAYKKPIPQPKYVTKQPKITTKKGPVPNRVVAGNFISDWLVAPTTGNNQMRRHSNNGVDLNGGCGVPVVSAAQGVVIQVNITKSTKRLANGGYGTNVRILHKNGSITLYAHLSKTFVEVNQAVNAGDLVGLTGGQPGTPGAGRSTGCHLHWEVRGAINPLTR
jgi:murein DD-endopeptidase MepM/ murein hydrolase activator NlpD